MTTLFSSSNMKQYIFFVCVLLVCNIISIIGVPYTGCESNVTGPTSIYRDYYNGNDKYSFYDPRTFGVILYTDPCQQINDNRVFRKFVSKQVECMGKWCVDGEFSCSS
jgi:hypothetical protein